MSGILARCQAALGSWVGSSVVHLGDHNVPNAMFFLNKYTQVPGGGDPIRVSVQCMLCCVSRVVRYVWCVIMSTQDIFSRDVYSRCNLHRT